MPPSKVSAPCVKAITVFLASTATPERGGLPYLDAVLPAEYRLAATRVVRDTPGAGSISFARRTGTHRISARTARSLRTGEIVPRCSTSAHDPRAKRAMSQLERPRPV